MRNVTQGAAVVPTHHAQCGTSPRLGTLEFVERTRCGNVAALAADRARHVGWPSHLRVFSAASYAATTTPREISSHICSMHSGNQSSFQWFRVFGIRTLWMAYRTASAMPKSASSIFSISASATRLLSSGVKIVCIFSLDYLITRLSRLTIRAPFTGSPASIAALILLLLGVGGL